MWRAKQVGCWIGMGGVGLLDLVMTLYIVRESSKVLFFPKRFVCFFPSALWCRETSISLLTFYLFWWLLSSSVLQLWKRVFMEISVELKLLREKWKLLLAGLIFQVFSFLLKSQVLFFSVYSIFFSVFRNNFLDCDTRSQFFLFHFLYFFFIVFLIGQSSWVV